MRTTAVDRKSSSLIDAIVEAWADCRRADRRLAELRAGGVRPAPRHTA